MTDRGIKLGFGHTKPLPHCWMLCRLFVIAMLLLSPSTLKGLPVLTPVSRRKISRRTNYIGPIGVDRFDPSAFPHRQRSAIPILPQESQPARRLLIEMTMVAGSQARFGHHDCPHDALAMRGFRRTTVHAFKARRRLAGSRFAKILPSSRSHRNIHPTMVRSAIVFPDK